MYVFIMNGFLNAFRNVRKRTDVFISSGADIASKRSEGKIREVYL